jgi:hypothetical protein
MNQVLQLFLYNSFGGGEAVRALKYEANTVQCKICVLMLSYYLISMDGTQSVP